MFVYWGGLQTGKKCAKFTCLLNGLGYTVLGIGNIGKIEDVRTMRNGDNWSASYVKHNYTKQGGFRYKKVVSKIYTAKSEDLNNNSGYEKDPQVDVTMLSKKYVNDEEIIKYFDRSKYNPYQIPFSLKSIDVHKTCIIGTPLTSDRQVFEQVSKFEGYTHIVPYRVLKDAKSIIPILNAWVPGITNNQYKDVLKLYDDGGKNIIFDFIASVWKYQRDVEQILKDLNVTYRYYDMDTHDLSTVIDFKEHLSDMDKGYPNWNLSDPIINQRYQKCWDIGEEFLKVTGLTDTRLDFRAKDGI